MEEWKWIVGFEGMYKVSNYGRVCSYRRDSKRILNGTMDKDGYNTVNLSKGNKYYNKKVHRLVASHFILNNRDGDHVNHKDGNKLNNHVGNLEWCTHQHNVRHAIETGLFNVSGENNPMSKLTDAQRNEIIELRKAYTKLKSIAKMYNISFGHVSSICLNAGLRVRCVRPKKKTT